jgi:ATP-binding cassette subfamily B protein
MRVAGAEVTTSSDKPPGEGAVAQLSLVIRYVGATMSAAVVATHAWWLVLVLVVPALVIRSRTRAQWLGMSRLQVRGATDGRRADYWRKVMTSPQEGKELRVFDFADWVRGRRREHVHRQMDPVWSANDCALRASGSRSC